MSTAQLAILRTVLTAVTTGLGAFATTHPQWMWLPGVLAGLAILGYHAVPSIGQQPAATPEDLAQAIVRAVEIAENPKAETEKP